MNCNRESGKNNGLSLSRVMCGILRKTCCYNTMGKVQSEIIINNFESNVFIPQYMDETFRD